MLKTDNSAKVLIISNEHDIHLTPVIEKLTERGVFFFRLNTENFFSKYLVTVSYKTTGEIVGSIKNNVTGEMINIEEITAIWERRPMAPMNTYSHIDELFIETIQIEQKAFYNQLRYSLDHCKWIGNPISELKASSKILQKNIARKLGFLVPDTLVSNSFSEIKAFVKSDHDYVVKPLKADSLQIDEDHQMVFYSRKVSSNDLLSLSETGVQNAPNYIQEYIEKQIEIRLTMVGNKAFAAKIDSQSMASGEGKEDWREGYDHGISFEAMEVGDDLIEKCSAYLKCMNLNFGCFDFVVDKKGEIYFLECNPNGQWLWIEDDTGLNISGAIADFLTSNEK